MFPLGNSVTVEIGKIIQFHRKRVLRISKLELAKRAFVSEKRIYNIEHGRVVAGFADVVGILRALDLDIVIVERPHEPTP